MATVGARELKTRLGRYLKLVREGATLIVTDRGRPIAELRPIPPPLDDEQTVIEELIALGKLTWQSRTPLVPFEAISIPGAAVADTVIAGREDRL